MFRKFDTFAKKYQMATTCTIAGASCAIGDVVSQKIVEKQENLDLRRTLTCTTWGMLFAAPFQTNLYRYWDRIWGETAKAKAKKVLLDSFAVPWAVFPAFYVYKGVLGNQSQEQIVSDINDRLINTIFASCVFWLPASTLSFTVLAPHMRVNFMFTWELVWAGICSYLCFAEQPLLLESDDQKALRKDPPKKMLLTTAQA